MSLRLVRPSEEINGVVGPYDQAIQVAIAQLPISVQIVTLDIDNFFWCIDDLVEHVKSLDWEGMLAGLPFKARGGQLHLRIRSRYTIWLEGGEEQLRERVQKALGMSCNLATFLMLISEYIDGSAVYIRVSYCLDRPLHSNLKQLFSL